MARSLEKKLKKLEKKLSIKPPEIGEFIMWSLCEESGPWGHVIISKEAKTLPDSVRIEKELKYMYECYEEKGKKRYPFDENTIPFSDYLEYLDFIGPERYAQKRKQIIAKIREEEKSTQQQYTK